VDGNAEGTWTLEDAQTYASSVLSGEKTRLRGIREDDLDSIAKWRQQVSNDILQTKVVNPASEISVRDYWRTRAIGGNSSDGRAFAVETIPVDAGDATFIGTVTFDNLSVQHRSALFAIALDPALTGRGYGRDAIRTMIRYGFRELGLHRIELGVWAFNTRALSAYLASGFVEEGRRRDAVFHDGRWHDEVIMSILSTDTSPSNDER
jgi:RimJ/RimL family protein N-acetyltransferase